MEMSVFKEGSRVFPPNMRSDTREALVDPGSLAASQETLEDDVTRPVSPPAALKQSLIRCACAFRYE